MPKGKRTMTTFSVYVPQGKGGEQVIKQLRALAKREGKSMSSLALEAILPYLKKREKPRRKAVRKGRKSP